MAVYPAVGTGPVSFLDGNESQQEIPLSAIFQTPNGWDATTWPPYLATATSANQPLINALLAQLASEGFLTPGAPPSIPALSQPSATAAEAGTAGNSISITFANPSLATGAVDVTVTATEVYSGLTPATLAATLGASAANATGLVYVTGAVANAMPGTIGKTPLGPGPGYQLAVQENGSATTAFTLAAASTTTEPAGQGADNIKVAVTLTPDQSSFSLTASWTLTMTQQSLSTLLTPSTNPFAYLVSFGGASGGPLPGAGTFSLSGGSNVTVSAVQQGTGGNSITITFANPSTTNGTVDVTVAATQDNPGLTPATLAAALGTSAATAQSLVYLSDTPSGNMPETKNYSISGGPGFSATVLEQDGATTAFTVAATSTASEPVGQGADNIEVAVTLAADKLSFDLSLSWSLKLSAVPVASLLSQTANPFSYLVSFAGSPGGPVPGAGTVALSGGSSTTAASAVVCGGSAASACIYAAA